MNEQQNIEVVQKAYGAFGRGDIPGVLALLRDDVRWVSYGPPDFPTAGSRTGHQQVQEFFAGVMRIGDIPRFEPRSFIPYGDQVIVIGDETAVVRASGKSVEYRWVHIFEVQAGLITSFEERGDLSELVAEHRAGRAMA